MSCIGFSNWELVWLKKFKFTGHFVEKIKENQTLDVSSIRPLHFRSNEKKIYFRKCSFFTASN